MWMTFSKLLMYYHWISSRITKCTWLWLAPYKGEKCNMSSCNMENADEIRKKFAQSFEISLTGNMLKTRDKKKNHCGFFKILWIYSLLSILFFLYLSSYYYQQGLEYINCIPYSVATLPHYLSVPISTM